VAETASGTAAGAAFHEGHVDADGFRIRYWEAGQGPVLVHLHGAGGPRLSRAHDLLSRHFRVIAFEMPGFGQSPENTRSRTMPELAETMTKAADALGLDRFALMGTPFGSRAALFLESPAAIRPEGARPPAGPPEEMARRLYGHPERMPPLPAPNPAFVAKQEALVNRLRGPGRDPELEARMGQLDIPTLVVFGTWDRIIPPEMGRHYKELMPNCHLVFVYDAGHAIGAERPEAFADLVTDYLERREAFVISRTPTAIHP
jgi:pimeloyl-ACP methyl ester carboxylesterase